MSIFSIAPVGKKDVRFCPVYDVANLPGKRIQVGFKRIELFSRSYQRVNVVE
jgi:hypothetical protein